MKIEYDGICTNVLKHCSLPCKRCAFFRTFVCPPTPSKPIFDYVLCNLNGFEKDPGYIFKV